VLNALKSLLKIALAAVVLIVCFAAEALAYPQFVVANESGALNRIDFVWYSANGVGSAKYFSVVAAPYSTTVAPIPTGYYPDISNIGATLYGHPGDVEEGKTLTWYIGPSGYEAFSENGLASSPGGTSEAGAIDEDQLLFVLGLGVATWFIPIFGVTLLSIIRKATATGGTVL